MEISSKLNEFNDVDILVIGAGFAGTVASRYAAMNLDESKKILMVESQPVPGQRIKCGEGTNASLFSDIELQPKPEWINHKVEKIYFLFPKGNWHYFKSKGYVLNRRRTLEDFAKISTKEGVSLLTSTIVTGYDYSKNKIKLRNSKFGNKNEVIVSPKIVIGCDGIPSIISQSSGLSRKNWRQYSTLGLEFRIKNYKISNLSIPDNTVKDIFFIFPEDRRIEYGWIFPKSENEINVGIVTPNSFSGNQAILLLKKFLDTYGISGTKIETISGVIPSFGPLLKFFKKGLLIAGDAAWHTNPITYGGIHTASIAGRLAGEKAAQSIINKDFSEKFLSSFGESITKKNFDHPSLLRAKEIIYGKNSLKFLSSLGILLNGFERLPLSKINMIKIMLKMLFVSNRISFSQLQTVDKALKISLKQGW